MQFIFREFIVDNSLFLIKKNGLRQEVEPRVFELLVYFCQHPNVPVSRDELIEHVWQQRTVGYAAINRAVSELRKILENEPSAPEIIITISKVGYQFTISPEIVNLLEHEQEVLNLKTKRVKPGIASFYSLIFITLAIMILYLAMPPPETELLSNLPERPLTSLKGTAFRATLSKDGADLLFIHKEKANSLAKVWLQRKDSPSQQLTDDNYYYTFAIFGANNQVIASRFNNLHQRKCEIVSIDLRSYKVTPIFDCAERALTKLAYSSKRNVLFFNFRTEVNSPFSIYAYQLTTARLQQITFPYSDGNVRGDHMLSLSPKEDRLAVFEYQKNSKSLLKVVQLSDNETDYHEHEFTVSSTMSWLNNDQIVVSDDKGIHAYHLNNKTIQFLTTNSSVGSLSANPLLGAIIFDKGVTVANIYQYAINNETTSTSEQPVTFSSFLNYQPQFANLSKKTAYISTDDGNIAIMIQPEQGQKYKAYFKDEITGLVNFHWSPDDSHLVATINNQLHLFSEKDKQWKILIPEQDNIHYVHFSNNENILFSSDISGDWQIWRLHINSEQLTQLTEKGGYSAQGDLDNNYLYLTKFNYSGLYRLNLITGEEEKLITDFQLTSWKKWQIRANTIYYVAEKSIDAFDIILNTKRSVMTHKERAPLSFSVSFDEQYIQREIIEESNANIWLIDTKLNELTLKN